MASETKKAVYVARDIERTLGVLPSPSYQIIANRGAYSETIKERSPGSVHLVEPSRTGPLDTVELLQDPAVIKTIDALASEDDAGVSILVFKNTPQIEAVIKKNDWKLLNPSAALAEKIENKITQVEWLGELAEIYLPEHSIGPVRDLAWDKEPFIAQWAHSHTGDGTILISTQKELADLKARFPERPLRRSAYLRGPSFTVNAVATGLQVAMGNISYQITGLTPFTDNPFSTVGNDWSATHTLLGESEIAHVEAMVQDIGLKIQSDGWRGLFGIDFMLDAERNRIYLIEINARQPASAVFESHLQEKLRPHGMAGATMFEAHLDALKGIPVDQVPIAINDGAQIIARNKEQGEREKEKGEAQKNLEEKIGKLEKAGYAVIPYENTEYNSDLLRIQSLKGIIGADGKLNKRGTEIREMISD